VAREAQSSIQLAVPQAARASGGYGPGVTFEIDVATVRCSTTSFDLLNRRSSSPPTRVHRVERLSSESGAHGEADPIVESPEATRPPCSGSFPACRGRSSLARFTAVGAGLPYARQYLRQESARFRDEVRSSW